MSFKPVMGSTSSPENQRVVDLANSIGIERLGIMSSQVWYDDPQGLLFTLSRYKFVSRMLRGKQEVLEIGCGDGFFSRIVQQQVNNLTVSDHDPLFIDDLDKRNPAKWSLRSFTFNPLVDSHESQYDGIYLLDVFEHINSNQSDIFVQNIIQLLLPKGILIVGVPSLASQQYASDISKQGHVNCMAGLDLKEYFEKFFYNVHMFSMNDEVLHTGFLEMSHYYFVVCNHPKDLDCQA